MNARVTALSVRVLFGAAALLMAINALIALYFAIFNNMNSPFAGQDALLRNALADAFTFQMAGYRLAMFVAAAYTFISNKPEQVFLFCLALLVVNAWQLFSVILTSTYNEQLPFIVGLILISIYCLWFTRPGSRS